MNLNINFRSAKIEDISTLVKLIADNEIGKEREDINDLQIYNKAFKEISKSANDYLIVMEMEGIIIGIAHLTIITHLSLKGAKRGNIETFHIDSNFRNKGFGTKLMKYILEYGKEKEVKIFQLTTNKKRIDAKRFYEKLGFISTHEGLKLNI